MFTVIVTPTGTGKNVVMKAMRVLVQHSCTSITLLPKHQRVSAPKMSCALTHERNDNKPPVYSTSRKAEAVSNEYGGSKRPARQTMQAK